MIFKLDKQNKHIQSQCLTKQTHICFVCPKHWLFYLLRNYLIRSSKHILKYSNKEKLNQLEQLFKDYFYDLEICIKYILENRNISKFISTRNINNCTLKHSQWQQIIGKQASEIVRSNIKFQSDKRYKRYKKIYSYFAKKNRQKKFLSKRFSELKLNNILDKIKINLNKENLSLNIDERLINFSSKSLHFNEFVNLKLPYFYQKKIRNCAVQINLPIKWHKQSLKFKDWNRKKTIQLKKINNNFYIIFLYEKEDTIQKQTDKQIGIDQGYKKLIVTSDKQFIGADLNDLYNKISKKKRGSENYQQLLQHKRNKINEVCNNLNLKDISTIFIEDLKDVKHKSKFHKKVNNKLQYWSYPQVEQKFEMLCQEQGIRLEKVSPAYTSQTCSECGFKHIGNRNKEKFVCLNCKIELDADFNAAKNILHRGVYNLSAEKNKNQDDDFINFY